MNTNGRNGAHGTNGHGPGWPPNEVGVAENNPFITPRVERDPAPLLAALPPGAPNAPNLGALVEPETAEVAPTVTERYQQRRRKWLKIGLALLTLAVIGLGWYARYTRRQRLEFRVADLRKPVPTAAQRAATPNPTGLEAEQTDQTTAEAIQQAKEELRRASAEPSPQVPGTGMKPAAEGAATTAAHSGRPPTFTPFVMPSETMAEPALTRSVDGRRPVLGNAERDDTGNPRGSDRQTPANGNRAAAYRNAPPPAAHSLYVTATAERRNEAVPEPPKDIPGATMRPLPHANSAFRTPSAALTIPVPSFGALLPVRTLGTVFTLRNSALVRLEVTRDVSGEGWTLRRGTLVVGQLQSGEYDRAFVNIIGFIDSSSGRLVRVAGDVLGQDGAPGLKGKRRRIDNKWGRVLGRVASGALLLGQAALARGGTAIVIPGSASSLGGDFGLSTTTLARKEFVEVAANTTAYVLITKLPQETPGVDAAPETLEREDQHLADDEWAELLTTGTPQQIRAALPRMTAEMRKLALAVLGERVEQQ